MNDIIRMVIGHHHVTLRLTENDRGLRRVWVGGFPGGKVTVIGTYSDRQGMDATRYAVEVTRLFEPEGKGGFDLGATLEQASPFFGVDLAVDKTPKPSHEDRDPPF